MKVKFKKLHPEAVTPSYSKEGDAGLDITCVNRSHNVKHRYYEYDTGLSVEIPYGYVGLIFPRSSISKYDLSLSNAVGVIDSGYRGEIKFRFKETTDRESAFRTIYQKGNKVGQLIIIPFPQIELEEVKELSSSERGIGGFGSTSL